MFGIICRILYDLLLPLWRSILKLMEVGTICSVILYTQVCVLYLEIICWSLYKLLLLLWGNVFMADESGNGLLLLQLDICVFWRKAFPSRQVSPWGEGEEPVLRKEPQEANLEANRV